MKFTLSESVIQDSFRPYMVIIQAINKLSAHKSKMIVVKRVDYTIMLAT